MAHKKMARKVYLWSQRLRSQIRCQEIAPANFIRQFQSKAIVENDIVLLKRKRDDSAPPILTTPLQRAGIIRTPRGSIAHEDIIGKKIRDVIPTSKTVEYRITQPTLGEYVTLCPRIVTPIYPADANLIVSLLDLHLSGPGEGIDGEPFEIFEAGTGHGALTIYLSRAIHGANSKPPSSPDSTDTSEEWLAARKAVIHTFDISPSNSQHAQRVVRNFRQGIYYPNIDFHVGDIEKYLSTRLSDALEPFLEHAILDLPSCQSYMDIIGRSIKSNGALIVFCPSITQINACVREVKDKMLPFLLETVLETGVAVGVGGREWDVRLVKPRILVQAEADARRSQQDKRAMSSEHENVLDTAAVPGNSAAWDSSGWEMVCRPKVGARVSGGGFLALWRRMEQY